MKLASIINLYDGDELLDAAMANTNSIVDKFIIVYQSISNHGEDRPSIDRRLSMMQITSKKILIHWYVPDLTKGAAWNEKKKREIGLTMAKQHDCTHFFFQDVDEFYEDPRAALNEYIESGADGSVARILTYFKKPTLRLKSFDDYYVPFIQKLYPDSHVSKWYNKKPYRVDPTRLIMPAKNIKEISQPMHHFSWCRWDIEMKARNSTAAKNILKSDLVKMYKDPDTGAGTYLKDYKQELIEVDDLFGLSVLFFDSGNPVGVI